MDNNIKEDSVGPSHADEFQDDTGLQLSLGLSLSSSDSRPKWRSSEGASARSSPSVDLTGEPSTGTVSNGVQPLFRHKSGSKASGLDAALKKFLEGRLDEQEESAKLLDGSNSFNVSKEKDKLLHEKPGQQQDIAGDAETKGNPFHFKELQRSSSSAGSRGDPSASISPLQLVDAFRNSPFGSNSGSPSAAEPELDADDSKQDNLDQQKKLQDVQKKRKLVVEEQLHHKKSKEESSGIHGLELQTGFRRSGSNTRITSSNKDMEKAFLEWREENHAQFQHDTGQEKQDSADVQKEYDADGDEITGFEGNVNANSLQGDAVGKSVESKCMDFNFMSQLKSPETVQKILTRTADGNCPLTTRKADFAATKVTNREKSFKGVPVSLNNFKDEQGQVTDREGDRTCSPLQGKRERVPSETSSVSTGGTEKVEEKSRGEVSSAVPEVMGNDKVLIPTTFCPPGPTSAPPLTYPMPYPVMQIPSLHSLSMARAPGMPLSVSGSFPYTLQYMPPGSGNSEQIAIRPPASTAFQQIGTDHSSSQLPTAEGTSWLQPVRPAVGSSFLSASNGALYSRNMAGVLGEDANIRVQASRMHGNGIVNNALAAEASSLQQSHQSYRGGSSLDQALEAPMPSPLSIPAVPHFTSQVDILDHGELRSLKEPKVLVGFPGFVSSASSSQAHASLVSAKPSSASGTKEDVGHEPPKFGGGRLNSSAVQQHVQSRNIIEPNNIGQEEFRRAIGSHFHQGTTENVSVLESLGEDMSFLQSGVAPGLKFGGTGTMPNLPWVHTTGSNGRTINGVLYKLNETQLKVVCACHGKHMSPVEFQQHASNVEVVNADKNVVVNPPLTSNAT
ncbi:hypothetical protein KP509_04G095100 [Ceratopteris richardii]|uniref:Tify domain-containing protein n=1 Tax=Ceratopteris richardii TaxID=49495 RepID=A0A8T2UZN0_CERRI|nr:hypothetical protein KP509_04G095100 [Ceratopteris richardii]